MWQQSNKTVENNSNSNCAQISSTGLVSKTAIKANQAQILNFQIDGVHIQLNEINNAKSFIQNNKGFFDSLSKFLTSIVQKTIFKSFYNSQNASKQASSNILLNIQNICSQLINKIKIDYQKIINQKQLEMQKDSLNLQMSQGDFDRLVIHLFDFINIQLKNIVNSLKDKYSQQSISKYYEKQNNKVIEIDLRQDYSLDSLYLTKEIIKETQNNQEMLNKILIFLQKVIKIAEEHYSSFVSFIKKILWTVSHSSIQLDQNWISLLTQENTDFPKFVNYSQNIKNLDGLIQYFNASFTLNYEKNNHATSQKSNIYQKQSKDTQFSIKNTVLLQLIVKWVQNIRQIYTKNSKYMSNNLLNFKNNDNNLIKLSQNQRKIINKCIRQAQTQVNHSFSSNRMKNNFQNSKGSEIALQLTKQFYENATSQLITSINMLLKIPQLAAQKYSASKSQSEPQCHKPKDVRQRQQKKRQQKIRNQTNQIRKINLVSSRLWDLLSTTIYCNQNQLIKLLALFQLLNDKYITSKQQKRFCFFKLVRIEDKLDTLNTVMINFLYKEKIVCEMKIIVKDDCKRSKINQINKYLQALEKGVYGIIPQLAKIICKQKLKEIEQKNQLTQALKKDKYSFINKKSELINCYHPFLKIKDHILDSFQYYCPQCGCLIEDRPDLLQLIKKGQLSNDDNWILDVLQKDNKVIELNKSIFTIQDQYQQIYLLLHKTLQKTIIQFHIIFYCTINSKLIIKSLQKHQIAKEFTQQSYRQDRRKNKLYIKINKTKQLLHYLQSSINLKTIKGYLTIKNIQQKVKQGLQQINRSLLKKYINNHQQSLILDNREGVLNDLQYLSLHNLKTIKKISAVRVSMGQFICFKSSSNIKIIDFSQNNIKGVITIQNYALLTNLNLSFNAIQKIQFKNCNNLQQISLNNNKLSQLIFDEMICLKKFQIQCNPYIGELQLSKICQLQYLNINYCNITKLNIQNSKKLKVLYCKKKKIKKQNLYMNILFNQGILLQELISINNLIYAQSLKRIKCWDRLQQLLLEVSDTNFDFIATIINKPFPKLEYLVLHFRDLTLEEGKLSKELQSLIYQQKSVRDIEIVFKEECKIQSLDLSELQHIQRFTVFDQTLEQEMPPFKVLKLNSVERLIVKAGLGNLEVGWGNVKQLTLSKVVFEKDLPFSIALSNKHIEKITINQCNFNLVKENLHLCDFPQLKHIDIQLTQIFGPQSPYECIAKQFQCSRNPQLKKLQLGMRTEKIEINDCPQLQTLSLLSKYNQLISSVNINLSSLKILELQLIYVHKLKLKISASAIKKIRFSTLVTLENNLEVQLFQKEKQKMDLEELQITNRHFQQLSNLLDKINSVKRVTFWFQSRDQGLQLKTSKICQNIYELRLTANIIQNPEKNKKRIIKAVKLIIDSTVSVVYLPVNVETVELVISSESIVYIREDPRTQYMQIKSIIINKERVKQLSIYLQVKNQQRANFYKMLKDIDQLINIRLIDKSMIP